MTSKYVCPWTSRIPAVLCRRHRTAWDLCGLVFILLLCLVLILVLCFLHPCLFHKLKTEDPVAASSKPMCLTADCVQTAASLLAAMDLNADPCDDFFQVCKFLLLRYLLIINYLSVVSSIRGIYF